MRHTKLPLFLCLLYIFFIGCQSVKETSYVASDTNGFRGKKISTITLKDGSIRDYNDVGGTFYEERADSTKVIQKIVGMDANSQPLNVNLDRILEVQCQTKQSDAGATILLCLVGGILVGYLAIIALFAGYGRFN